MQEILVLRVGAIQVLDEAHELSPGKPRQRPLYRSPVLCHGSSPFQFLHGIFSTDIVRKVKTSSQCPGTALSGPSAYPPVLQCDFTEPAIQCGCWTGSVANLRHADLTTDHRSSLAAIANCTKGLEKIDDLGSRLR